MDTTTFTFALYAQHRWRLSPLFELQPGVRAYYHDAGHHYQLDPRLALVYHYDVDMRFKLALGRYTQLVNVMTFGDAFSNFDVWIPVDGSMRPAYSHRIIAGWEWDRDDGLAVTSEAYYTDMHNVSTWDPLADRTEGKAEDAFVMGEGKAYGAEFMIRKSQGKLTGWLGYSLSWTKRRFPHSLINQGAEFYPKYDRRHDIILVVNYQLNPRWDCSTTWRYNTGQGYTEGVGLYTQRLYGIEPEFTGTGGRRIVPGEINNYRFPADHRLDVTFSYHHHFLGKQQFPAKWIISVYNAYNRRPYWERDFDTQPNPIQITDLKLLPILPLVGYEVRF